MNEQEKKEFGISLASQNKKAALSFAREQAVRIGSEKGFCSVDDVRLAFSSNGFSFPFGNWAGSIFKDGNWLYEKSIQSTHINSHGRLISLWRYCPNKKKDSKNLYIQTEILDIIR